MKISEIGKWYYLLNKRLLRRVEFLAILIVLPLLIFGVRIGSTQEKGVLHIILLTAKHPDENAKKMTSDIQNADSIIRYTITDDAFHANQMLIKQEADAIWVIPNDLSDKVKGYVTKRTAFITIYQTGESTVMNLAKEKLYQSLYPMISYAMYEEFMLGKIEAAQSSGMDTPKTMPQLQKDLQSYHEQVNADSDFLEFLSLDGKEEKHETKAQDYLLSPMRGILSIWLFVAIMVANLYFLKDQKNGLFDFVDRRKRIHISLVYKISISINLFLLMLLTLWLTGQIGDWKREILGGFGLFGTMLLFAELLCRILPDIYVLCVLLFPISTYFFLTAPIFVDLGMGGLRFLSLLNPVYYYLGYIGDASFFASFLSFGMVLLLLVTSSSILQTRK